MFNIQHLTWTIPLATGAGIAGICLLTIFIQNTVIVGLFEGEPHALGNINAGRNAVLRVSNFEGINEVAYALECPMTFASRTAVREIY